MACEENGEQRGFWASFLGPKNARGYKWVSTALVLAFLVVGGFVAWVGMKNAASNLAGVDSYNQLSANSVVYEKGSVVKAGKEENFFASEEESATVVPAPKNELPDSSGGAAARSASMAEGLSALGSAGRAGGTEGGGFSSGPGQSWARPQASGSGIADKLVIKDMNSGQLKGGQTSKTTALRSEEANGSVSVRLAQAKNDAPGAGIAKGSKTAVLEALKSAFKANLYGARLASQDAARGWIAKKFDATSDSAYSLEYDEKMKAKLDRINPDSIPKFLRDQNLDVTNAKSLGVSEVVKPEVDKEGTKEALKNDKDYQEKKEKESLAKALFTPMGPFTGSAAGGGAPAPADGVNVKGFSNPDGEQTFSEAEASEGGGIFFDNNGGDCNCPPNTCCSCVPLSPLACSPSCDGNCGPYQPGHPCAYGSAFAPVADEFDPNKFNLYGDFPPMSFGNP